MKGNLYTLIYAAILGLVCALLLTVVGQFTAPYIAQNRIAEEMRNVLGVLGIQYHPQSRAAELTEIFDRSVRTERREELTVYRYVDQQGQLLATAVPFEGSGMWAPIKGFLALEPDGRTIRGVRFHEQQETPGLGGRISEEAFTARFGGRTIADADGRPGLRIGSNPQGLNEIDGITGATMTVDKVQQMLNRTIQRITIQEQTREQPQQ